MKKHYKYPEICVLGHEENSEILQHSQDFICVEEKVDGGNGSFFADDETGEIYECSRNCNMTTDKNESMFLKQRLALREKLKTAKLNPDFIYYVEFMAKHTINYTNVPEVIGLDIRPKHSANEEGAGLFLGREFKEQEFARLGIECVPLVWKGTAGELSKMKVEDLIPKSKYYDGMSEGIVIKNFERKSRFGNHQIFAKLVRQEFKEVNKTVFGSVRQENSETNKIVGVYFTEARIRKMIMKLVNEEGMKLDRTLMKFLPTRVIKDVLKEEFNDIYDNYKYIDFKELKQKVPKICLNMIDKMMLEKVIV